MEIEVFLNDLKKVSPRLGAWLSEHREEIDQGKVVASRDSAEALIKAVDWSSVASRACAFEVIDDAHRRLCAMRYQLGALHLFPEIKNAFSAVLERLSECEIKYGAMVSDECFLTLVIAEEAGEVVKALNDAVAAPDEPMDYWEAEVVDTAAAAIRALIAVEKRRLREKGDGQDGSEDR